MTELELFFAATDPLGLSRQEQEEILGSNAVPETGAVPERAREAIRVGQALGVLWPDGERRAAWLRAPNQGFDGRSGRELLLSSQLEDVRYLRRHVEYWAYNGW